MIGYPSRRYYEGIAATSGYPMVPLETVYRLADLLARIEIALPGELLLSAGAPQPSGRDQGRLSARRPA